MTTTIPCKRPRVTVDPRDGADTYDVNCHVPACGFTYPADKQFHALKVDADDHARIHRQAHRTAVPVTLIDHDVEWDVHCQPCGGHRRTFSTRTDAQAWLDHHLTVEHGLVTCP